MPRLTQLLASALAPALALPLLLTSSLAHADPSGLCCFQGQAGICNDPAVPTVCALDPWCCSGGWDLICIEEFEDVTSWTCPPRLDGVYNNATSDNPLEISAFASTACGAPDPADCQWTIEFDLPNTLTPGTTATEWFDVDVRCDGGGWGGGAGGGGFGETVQILSVSNNVVRGKFNATWFFEEMCAEEPTSVLFQVLPRTSKSCYAVSTAPRCHDPSIELCVCHDDPYCCQTAWDGLCVMEANACD
jgi:hypothetical protein